MEIDESFAHNWRAEVLARRPLILPARHFTYPGEAEEVERGALEVLVRPAAVEGGESLPAATDFLATCALGFRDPAVPTGLWSAPHPDWLCAVSGGYAYLIDTVRPTEFAMIELRPVMRVLPAPEQELLLFVGHTEILGWGRTGEAWHARRLSDEGIHVERIEAGVLHGRGWQMRTDREVSFALKLMTGKIEESGKLPLLTQGAPVE